MSKRFSAREIGLLMSPVLAIGVVGLLFSKRPISVEGRTASLVLKIEKPTTLEAFQGAQGAFVVELQQPAPQFRISGSSAFLELQTPRGPIILRVGTERKGWGNIWHGNINGTRFPVNISQIPPGNLSFNCKNILYPATSSATSRELQGKWKIDRSQLKAPDFAAMPRQPQLSLREVKISRIDSGSSYGSRRVSGEAIFQFEGAAMTNKTLLELKIFSPDANMGSGANAIWSKTPKKRRRRITEWTIYALHSQNPMVRVSGRVSADNRWPLGFQIEPFNFKMVKVGQKLKFKQFPVPLPKD